MLRKTLIAVWLLSVLLAACGGGKQDIVPTIIVSPGTPGAYPGPGVVNPVVTPRNPYPAPAENPFAPVAGDEAMNRGVVHYDLAASEILVAETFPVQATLRLVGTLPNACHQLRAVVSQPDALKHINVEVYSVVEKDKICTEVLAPFDAQIPLGSFAAARFAVYVNGELLGEFDS